MNSLPDHVMAYKKTPVFTQGSMPPGLLKTHKTKQGVWGVLSVLEGSVVFCPEQEDAKKIKLSAGDQWVIQPDQEHHLELDGLVSCYVEFYK
ncbi:hypothetical protein GZ78_19300 [Endozoicomonas numazuensis]|uniref:TehB/YeaR-like domain-containing protein n=2 Tax=Endozoicomonas numazuensis TaxID=1137799 RepID=A0A081NEE6_9GAMM|nr:hypothetical protein GZ78_19300 [Endozoicomonas numazuensis]